MIEKWHGDMVFWLQQMGKFVKECMQDTLLIETKTNFSDVVTNVDYEIEKKFIDYIHTFYPSHSILGEESATHLSKEQQEGYVWVIDPIDGTLNFIKEQKHFAIVIALYVNGVGQLGYIYDVINDKLYYAIKGQGAYCNHQKLQNPADLSLKDSLINVSSCFIRQAYPDYYPIFAKAQGVRMIGSASHSMLAIFNNQHHAYISMKLRPWDFLAGLVFANELGLVYSKADGSPLSLWESSSFIIGTPKIHQDLILKNDY